MMTAAAAIAGTALGLTWVLTGWVRRYAISRSLLDIPNPRSLHRQPVPRGGGLAIAAVALTGTIAGGVLHWVPSRLAIALVGGGALVAVIGWLDDRRDVDPLIRAAVQCLAACWAMAWLGGLPRLGAGAVLLDVGIWGWGLGVIGIMWAMNFYNFMDGIDGLAAGEAVSVALAASIPLCGAGYTGLAYVTILIGAASAGFLMWNWPPARIFLGDVGSALLGFLFATLAVASENAGALPVAAWLLLLGVFFVDATLTVGRRIARGEVWYQAHRSHAYQRAVQAGLSHRWVTTTIVLLNLVLGAMVWLGWRRPGSMPWLLALGFGGLGLLYWGVERWRPMVVLHTRSASRGKPSTED
jgi:Fuc2NAc and GlcNAc transferase